MKDKKELTEIRFDAMEIILRDNLVRGAILPQKMAELKRNIIFDGNVEVEGAVFGRQIEIRGGDITINGAVFAQNELHVASDVTGAVVFKKSVGSSNSIVSRASKAEPTFCSDINSKIVALKNAYVAGNIYADEVTLENCVVIGGVFATQEASINNSIIGTFNTPRVRLDGTIQLLLPSAFTIEKPITTPTTRLYNLSLADLGDLFLGKPQDPHSGRISMSLETDEVRSNLSSGELQRSLRSLTVIGKVLAADLVDTDKFHNHFLITAASLGSQLLKVYDLGEDKDGNLAKLDTESLRKFFFELQSGKIVPQDMSATFSLSEIVR